MTSSRSRGRLALKGESSGHFQLVKSVMTDCDRDVVLFTVEQIVAKLREAEKLQAQGLTIPQTCKRLQISDQTFYRWRLKYGAMKEDEAHRLKALEQENSRLKRIVAEQALDISMLRDLTRGKF